MRQGQGGKGVKGYELNFAAPLGDQFWGAFVGADPPKEVPAHPSGEMWMNAGTLPSSGYLGYCSFDAAGPSHREPGDGKSGGNSHALLQPIQFTSTTRTCQLKTVAGVSIRMGKVFPSNSMDCGLIPLSLEGQGHPWFLEPPTSRAAVLA